MLQIRVDKEATVGCVGNMFDAHCLEMKYVIKSIVSLASSCGLRERTLVFIIGPGHIRCGLDIHRACTFLL